MSIELVIPSNHLILFHPLLLLPFIFPSIRVFSNESALRVRWPKYWSFSFSISPSSEYSGLISFRIDWFESLSNPLNKTRSKQLVKAGIWISTPALKQPKMHIGWKATFRPSELSLKVSYYPCEDWGGEGAVCVQNRAAPLHTYGDYRPQCVFRHEWHPTIPTQFVGYNVNNGPKAVQLSNPLLAVTQR